MRKYLSILLVLTAFVVFGSYDVAPALDGQYRSVTVDTSRLQVRGRIGPEVKSVLTREISRALGPRLGRSGSPLVVRLHRIYLPPNSGESSWGGVIEDSIEGVVIVPGRGQIPIRVSLPPESAGAWYSPDFEQRRVINLLEVFAQWTAKYI